MTQLQSIIASLPYPKDSVAEMLEYNFQVAVYLTFTLMGQFTQCEVHSIKSRAERLAPDCRGGLRGQIQKLRQAHCGNRRGVLNRRAQADHVGNRVGGEL